MPRLQIDLDAATTEALSSLAVARGTTPADLVAEIVGKYVMDPRKTSSLDPLERARRQHRRRRHRRRIRGDPPDAMDALVGKHDAGRVQGQPHQTQWMPSLAEYMLRSCQ